MTSQNVFYDTKDLPGNILTLVDDSFYDFIEQRLGVDRSLLLKLQQINSVPCLLLTNDPCEILNLNIDDHDLNLLKNKMCFLLYDGSFVVKPGVITGFKCLRELLTKKTEEKLKHSRNTKTQFPTAPPINIITSPPSFLTSSITTTVSTSQATTTSAPPPQQSATTTAPQQSPPVSLSHASPSTSISEHRKYVVNLLKQWCFNHKNDFNLDTFDLNEGKDFILYVIYNQNKDLEPSIKCNCGRLIVLTIKNGKIQLSNYQKHLRTATCTHMNSLKKLHEEGKKSDRQQTISDLSSSAAVTSTAAPQQQAILQAPVLVSPGASSIVIPPTSDAQSTISQTNLRKRSQPSSQLSSSSQKTKRPRT